MQFANIAAWRSLRFGLLQGRENGREGCMQVGSKALQAIVPPEGNLHQANAHLLAELSLLFVSLLHELQRREESQLLIVVPSLVLAASVRSPASTREKGRVRGREKERGKNEESRWRECEHGGGLQGKLTGW